jgi:O-antigen ligase
VSAILERRGAPAAGWLLGLLGLCAAVGLAAGVSPKYGLLAPIGLAFVIVVFADLVLGIAMFAALSFLDVLTIGGAALSFDKVAGLLLFVSWGLRQATAPREISRDIVRRHPALFVALLGFVAWSLISVLWATRQGVSIEEAYRDALEMLLIPIVYTAVRSRRDLQKILFGYLIGAGFSAVYGLAHPPAASSQAAGRVVGALGEANSQATVLVAGIALAAGLAITARYRPKVRVLIVVAGALSLAGLVTTLSRAGLIAFGVVLVAGVFIGGRWRKPAAVLMIAGLIATPVYFLAFAPANALDRVTNSQTSGRNDIWKVAVRMFEAHPLLGVGAGNFQYVSANYLQHPGLITAGDYFLVSPKVAQSIYLEQLASLGLPGFLLMVAFFVAGIGIMLRAAHIFERLGDVELELTARAAILALIAFLAADVFASELISKQLWLVFALGPALLKLADIESRTGRAV